MDNILDSLSKTGKKLKHRLRGKKPKPDRTEANTPGESAGLSGSLLQPESYAAAGGHDGEGNITNADIQQDRSRNQSPQPEPMPAGRSDDDRQRGEVDVGGKGEAVSQSHSPLGPDVEVLVTSREAERVYPPLSTGGPDST